MGMSIKHTKAYTATYSPEAHLPNKNFLDVLDNELANEAFKVLVIGGGSADITNINTQINPEENIESMREEASKSAKELFCLAESALANFPSLQKVVLMKRTPRYDPIEVDPLGLKPQLSSLADSVSFGYWCESKYRDKIILGGHTIPHGDFQHKQVFGVPGSNGYDGLHMKGPDGKQFLTQSILKVLVKANLAEQNLPARNVQNSIQHEIPTKTHRRSHRRESIPHYDPMDVMLKRIRTFSRAQTQPSPNHLEDDVFFHPLGRKQPLRPSVITGTLHQSGNHYSVPVYNRFEALGN